MTHAIDRLLDDLHLMRGSRVLHVGLDTTPTAERLRDDRDVEVTHFTPASDLSALPHDDGCFDAIVSESPDLHGLASEPAATELTRVLGTGGLIALLAPTVESELPERLAPVDELWPWLTTAPSLRDLQRLYLEAGLRVVSAVDESGLLREQHEASKTSLLAETWRDAKELLKFGVVQLTRVSFAKGRPHLGDGARKS
ncbi:MAG: hypothetical protein AAF533_18985 [Acidobacteriota bacterium]